MTGKGRVSRIDATYRVVTPMFCGGVDPSRSAELRLPSFKGVLRFWWRVLAWGRLGGDLEKIWKQEAKLFGSADGGQSRVSMRLGGVQNPGSVEAGSVLGSDGKKAPWGAKGASIVGPGAGYLGYGVMEPLGQSAGKLSRPCVVAPFDFTVHMRFRASDSGMTDSLKRALIALGTFGGMGAKSRKGYGSLALVRLAAGDSKPWKPPANNDDLYGLIKRFKRPYNNVEFPPYTALSGYTRHLVLSKAGSRPLDLLDSIGCDYKDHIATTNPPEKRAEFGLPRHLGKDRIKAVGEHDRRASPLFIHLHECGRSQLAVLSLLPAEFLPSSDNGVRVGNRTSSHSVDRSFGFANGFLNQLRDQSDWKEIE